MPSPGSDQAPQQAAQGGDPQTSWPAPDQQWQQPGAQQWQQPSPEQQWGQPSPEQQQWQQPSGWTPAGPQQQSTGYAPPSGQSMYGVRPEPQQQPVAQQGGYGQFTFPVVPKQPLEPLAVAGVATSPLGPVGVILSLMARGRVKSTRRRSMGLVWAGVGLGALFTVGWTLALTVLSLNGTIDRTFERPEAGDVAQPRTIAAANLAVGNCISTLPPAQEVGEVRLVPCADEHIAQVVTMHELSGEFPGDEALADQATSTCTADVDQLDAGDASIVPWYLVPSATGWGQGNTQVVCLLRGDAGPLHVDLVNS